MKRIDLCLANTLHSVCSIGKLVCGRKPQIIRNSNEKPREYSQKLLMVAFVASTTFHTIRETVECLLQKSRYQIDLYNAAQCERIPSCIDFSPYDGILFHDTVTTDLDRFYRLTQVMQPSLSAYHGIKVLIKQDELYRAYKCREIVREFGFDLVVTLCDEKLQEYVYQKSQLFDTQFLQFYTGYISDKLKSLPCRFQQERPVDVGYRATRNRLFYGRLTYEKYQIGELFRKYAAGKNLKIDISSNPNDFFYGDRWLDFLGSCKITLGVESGGSIIDITGDAERTFNRFTQENPDATDEEILRAMEPFENGPIYSCVSPRHLEAAACGTLQLLYEGEYQGIFQPYRHYLPLKRDWSNIDELMKIALDPTERNRITQCAYEEIVQNPRYSFGSFVHSFDGALTDCFARKAIR